MLDHSVVILTRNHAPFIAACVESVLGQSRPPGEIIVHDAGSTDGTLEILHRYKEKLLITSAPSAAQAPSPQSEINAIHSVFLHSKGRLIFLLDGDDRFKPDKIARYTDAFDANPDASVVQAPLERIDRGDTSLGIAIEPRYHVENHLREIYLRQDLNFFYPASALAFSRYYLERILPLNCSDNLPLWLDARLCIPAAYYGRIVTLPDPLTDWRYYATADTARVTCSSAQLAQIRMRAQVFNAFCKSHGLKPISPWRNSRLYLHLFGRLIRRRIR